MNDSVEKMKFSARVVHDLSLNLKETATHMDGVARELHHVKRFFAEGDKPKLIGLGVTMILIPEPTGISDVLGAAVVSAGLIQAKIKKSALHIEDIYSTFARVMRDVKAIR